MNDDFSDERLTWYAKHGYLYTSGGLDINWININAARRSVGQPEFQFSRFPCDCCHTSSGYIPRYTSYESEPYNDNSNDEQSQRRTTFNTNQISQTFEDTTKPVYGYTQYRDHFGSDVCGNVVIKEAHGKQSTLAPSMDHRDPYSNGGSNHSSNMQILQWKQNIDKSDSTNYNYSTADNKGYTTQQFHHDMKHNGGHVRDGVTVGFKMYGHDIAEAPAKFVLQGFQNGDIPSKFTGSSGGKSSSKGGRSKKH